jgi:hypothetical protein
MITIIETWNHPEAKEDEVFVGNGYKNFFEKEVNWLTKRLGTQAFDPRTGEKIDDGYFPIFVKKKELKEHNVRIVMRQMEVKP